MCKQFQENFSPFVVVLVQKNEKNLFGFPNTARHTVSFHIWHLHQLKMLIVPFWWNILRAQHTTCTSESKMHGCGLFRENTAAVLTNHTHYYGIEEHNILCAICVLLKLKVRCIGHMHGVTKTRFTCPWNNFTYSENVRRATDYNSMHTETEHIR